MVYAAASPQLSKSPISSQIGHLAVTSVHRGSSGFLWIGTQEGLYKFDGATKVEFNSNNLSTNWIPETYISDIAEASDGTLYVSTVSGNLLAWNSTTATFREIAISGPNESLTIYRIYPSSTGLVWIATSEKILLYDPKLEVTRAWLDNVEFQALIERPSVFFENSAGHILVGNRKGLARIIPHQEKIERIELPKDVFAKNVGISAIESAPDGNLYIGSNTGQLALLDSITWAPLAILSPGRMEIDYISDLLLHDEKLFIATGTGLYHSGPGLHLLQELENSATRATSGSSEGLYLDGDYIWVGSHGGLDTISMPIFETFRHSDTSVSRDFYSFAEDGNGDIWIGTLDGAYIQDTGTGLISELDSHTSDLHLLDKRVTAIATRGYEVWLGFFMGGVQTIDLVSRESSSLKIENSIDLGITHILPDPDSHQLIVSTYEQGLYRTNNTANSDLQKIESFPENSVSFTFRTSSDELLVAASNRLYRQTAEGEPFALFDSELEADGKSPTLYSIQETKDGDVWLGTKNHGLFRWSQNSRLSNSLQLDKVRSDTSLIYATIYGIEVDSKGNLWCSTQNGIVKLDESGKFLHRFTKSDGLQGNDFSQGASFRTSKGTLYFGGNNGFNAFDPAEIPVRSSEPIIKLTGINFPSASTISLPSTNTTNLQLTHNDRYITFKFAVLDFLEPDKNQYRYTLENFDPEWIESGRKNTATYTNLPPGDYVFRAQGANSAGIWNREGVSINVQVLPPPWLMWWAFCIYAGVLALMLWGIHRIYQSYAIDRRAAEMAIEMHAAEEKADDDMQEQLELQQELVRSAYEHNVTTLSLVGGFITNEAEDRIEGSATPTPDRSTKRVAALAHLGECVYFQAGGSLANMKEYVNLVLADLIAQSSVDPETIIAINEISSRMMPAEIASPLAVVIYELLQNCLQHGFPPESPANYITITLKAVTGDESLVIAHKLVVRDNGVGAPADIVETATENSGTAVVHALVEKLGGSVVYSVTSGTTISITLPNIEFD